MRQAANKPMKRFMRPIITIGLGLVLALFSAALTTYSASPATQGNLSAETFSLQSTSTPQPKDHSEIGSTDGIIVMGFIIAVIIILPIALQRKSWVEPR